ncbi:MAG TPA: SGNH/GDSL hydrolase family protein [Albitalea sp.]|nr:SGNH/GDSL hydrolase family protein [Albitalea sp.]
MSLAAKLILSPLLVAQAVATRRRAPVLPEAAGAREGIVGDGPPCRVLIVGDSSAAGVGVPTQDIALAGHFARTLAAHANVSVHWRLLARSGINSAQALAFVQSEPIALADFAVVVLGVNDVVDQVPSQRAVRRRAALADWLLEHAQVRHVVFAPLPPMHQFPLLPQPLRWILGSDARRHDAAVARWAATRSDVWHVPIAIRLDADCMAPDGFHPGEPVYRHCGEALARFIAEKLSPPSSKATP